MESKIKSSFIPKQPLVQKPAKSARYKSSSVDLMMLISIVLLAVSIVLSVGVFLYKGMAVREIQIKKDALQKAKDTFDPPLIKEMQKLSKRIKVAQDILDNHIAPSIFLHALEKDTLSGIQFTDFKFKPKNNNVADFSLKGKTSTVNSVALQSTRFSDSDIIKKSIFSDIDLTKDGVTFNVTGELDLDTLRFANVVNGVFQQTTFESDPMGTPNDLLNNPSEVESNDVNPVDINTFGDFGNF